MRNYEIVYIVSPEIEEENLEAVTEKITQMVVDGGGQVLRLDPWGRRKLAYPIQNFREGHYVVAQIELEPAAISDFQSKLGLAEEIIRYLVVRTEERPMEPAQAEPSQEPSSKRADEEDTQEEEPGG